MELGEIVEIKPDKSNGGKNYQFLDNTYIGIVVVTGHMNGYAGVRWITIGPRYDHEDGCDYHILPEEIVEVLGKVDDGQTTR